MDVTIYTNPTCPYCTQAKDFFKEKGIKFKEKNVDADESVRKEAIEKSGQMGVPVILIDDKVIMGFDKEKIEAALK